MAWFDSFFQFGVTTRSAFMSYLLFTVTLGVVLYYVIKRQKKVWLIDRIPGPKTIPIFGNALQLFVEPVEQFKRSHFDLCDYGSSISRVWIGSTPLCLLYKSSAMEHILTSQKHITKSREYRFIHPWLGNSLLNATGKRWQRKRKMLTPSFHFKILENFIGIFNEQSSKLVKNLEKKAGGQIFDLYQFITLCTLDIILETAMGRKINAQDNVDSDYVQALYKMTAVAFKRWYQPWLRPDFLFRLSSFYREQTECLKILHNFSNETIRDRKKDFKKYQEKKDDSSQDEDRTQIYGKKKHLAFLDLLLEHSEEGSEEGNNSSSSFLSDKEIREEVDTFMFEGHDTTSSAINWTIYMLGLHPEIQEKVFDELDSIFGGSDRPAAMSDLNEMKYLECCIKEAMRIYPPVPMVARELQENTVIDGFEIPSGTTLMFMIFRLHRDPEQFPDPEVYKPERFSSETPAKHHNYAYLPFSAGPRNCIGKKFAQIEEKIVISTLLRKYRVESTVEREKLSLTGNSILRSENGNLVKIFPRK